MRIKKTLAGAALATLALTALGACGSDSDGGTTKSEGDSPKTADIRVWLNGADTPQEARDWLKTTFEDQNPGSTLRPTRSPGDPIHADLTGMEEIDASDVEAAYRPADWIG